ncbi:DNA polymerase III subunit gamma and tau [Rothia sp. (in: high G+C Gram-positive bacteria)]|uniref:DNA polymerase III subunit gamma and tau n=1 Tax=Rothia sp. (in: high G+C Gram-positive bacteria) TaxID=1885016 RepID=UPI001CAB5B6B|nr:DNA polymerase III subunit gamma and tau [Rothia sp. (in: high G+C Gram-positive bacteria)]MBF1667793.1 DNA polymerase III subunit gamma and tau [Rothia sp. (in: high G+C Gram-positive bacteria)]
MSTALYRRYRPETFAEVIGQEHVTEPLMVALEKNRVNHAYLFSGPRGCGKTTSARILARCLNCAQGPTPTPCGVCDSCRELSRDGGGSLDVIEMDAASHGGVDHARDLRERATLAPVRDRYKIFIIDEAHMVTREGFNALLKTVEEPPEHVKFIFATTEPNKVLGTIRSRTHHYPFRLVPPEILLPFLQGLCDQEQVAVEPGVLQLVIRAGGGSVRDSLSILDQLMAGASSQNGIEYDRAVALLGYTHAQLLDEVIEALGAKDAPTLFGAVSRVVATGQDPRRFVEDLLERLRDLIVVKAVPQAAGQILQGVPQDQLERLAQQAQALGERELTVAAGTANETLNGMTGAANPQLQLELLCARLLLPAVEGSAGGAEVAALASRLQVLERRVASGAAGSAPAGSGPAQGGMSAARAAGMAAAGLTPKTQAPQIQAPNAQTPSSPVQEAAQAAAPTAQQPTSQQAAPQQGSSQHASASAPPLAGAPLSAAPLAPTAQAPATQAPAPAAGAPLAGNAPAAPNAPASAAAPAGAPSAPLKLDPNDPLAAVQGNWRAILNRMSVPGAAEQLMKVRPARMDGATLYVSGDIATLRAVKGFVPELTARVSEFLRRQVTIHAQVAKPGEQVKPAAQPVAQPAAPSAPAAQPAVPAAVAPQVPQQPVQQTPPQSAQPAPLADGPRGGEDAWRRHGQPLTGANTPESTSVDAPLGAWEVAPIPQSAPEEAPQQAAVQAPVQEAPAGPLAPEPPVTPVAQQVPTAPAGGFGERDSFAASGSGVPQQESAPEPQHAQEPPFSQEPPHVEEPPYEEEPPFEDEPAYAEPVEAPTAPAMPVAPAMPAQPVAPAGPLATPVEPAGPLATPVEPAGPLAAPVAPAEPLAPAGPLAEAPQAAAADTAPASDEKPAAQTSNAPATPTPNAPTPNAPAAPARPARAASDEDYVSEDDEKVENSTFIGLRAIEKIIGGTVIDERPLHQP